MRLGLLLLVFLLPACGPRNFLNENDRLRKENLDLRRRVESLSQRAAGLKKRLEAEKRESEAGKSLPEGVYQPAATSISIGRYSGGVDTDEDPANDTIRLYLSTTDRRGRFIQTLATVKVSAVAIPPGEQAKTVATATIDAKAFDQAYRSGITGTHYTLTIPVDPAAVPPGTEQLTVRVALTNLMTGQILEAEKTINWSGESATP